MPVMTNCSAALLRRWKRIPISSCPLWLPAWERLRVIIGPSSTWRRTGTLFFFSSMPPREPDEYSGHGNKPGRGDLHHRRKSSSAQAVSLKHFLLFGSHIGPYPTPEPNVRLPNALERAVSALLSRAERVKPTLFKWRISLRERAL
jgi:hypothetical protein